jgi:hemolysin activation/secretion protein
VGQTLPGELDPRDTEEEFEPPTRPLERKLPPDAAAAEPQVLPPLGTPSEEEGRLSIQARVFVRKFRLTGNTVFSEAELASVTAPYENRIITSEEIQEVRQELTRYYADRGYINSGAVIPDQKITEGVIHIHLVEGRLTEIQVSGNQRLRSGYIQRRLGLGARPPLNIGELQEQVQILSQNPLIERINAELGPGVQPGEGLLRAQVQEQRPYSLDVAYANDRPPSVGAERLVIEAAHRNLTGWGDALELSYSITEGAGDRGVRYTLPLNARDTSLHLRYLKSDTLVIEESFEDLDIESETETVGVGVSHPLYRTPRQQLTLGLSFDRLHSETFIFGEPFSFSLGAEQGESDVAVLRFSQEWLDRSLTRVIAARSVLSLGVDAFGATVHASQPDSQFLAWLGQFQWAQRIGERGTHVITRTALQLTNDALLPLEQFAVGGIDTVRGYRENQLLRDNAFIASVELRLPILQNRAGESVLQLAPFADFGVAWNKDETTSDPEDTSSVGLGLRWDPNPKAHAEVYWGLPLREVDNPDNDLQDRGIHFLVSYRLF